MATVMNVNHFSIYLKRNMECTVILPSHIKNDEKIPVLWLYHGGSGDNTVWLYHSPIAEYVDECLFTWQQMFTATGSPAICVGYVSILIASAV